MQISSRFTIAIHILISVELYGEQEPATSESLAGSIGAHPVVIRRILEQLRRAGLIRVARGREGDGRGSRAPSGRSPSRISSTRWRASGMTRSSASTGIRILRVPSDGASTRSSTVASMPSSARWRRPPSRM